MTARSIASAGLLVALLPAAACDRWKEPFRVHDSHALLRAAERAALPASASVVRWESHTVPQAMLRGSSADARIAFTNVGDVVWPDVLAGDPDAHTGGHAVRLAYEWTPVSAAPVTTPDRRVDLPHPVHPGETMTLLVPLDAPAQIGDYRITFALVQELVAWFVGKGAATLVVPVTVK